MLKGGFRGYWYWVLEVVVTDQHLDPLGHGPLLHQHFPFHNTPQMLHVFHHHVPLQPLPLGEVGFGEVRGNHASTKG